MKARTRTLFPVVLAFAFLPHAAAQQRDEYPAKPIRIIVPFAPGGPMDALGRPLMQKVGESLGVPMVIDNRAGANGIVGTELVARAPRDGYTLLYTTGSHVANPSIYRKLPYDTVRDFAPVTQIARAYGQVLVVHPSFPAKNVKELIALARAKPGALNYASAGAGNATHLAAELLFSTAKVSVTNVTYKGGGPALNDVLSGQVEMMFVSSSQGMPFIKAGRVRALGISGAKRAPALPDVPTFEESGFPGVVFAGWHGMWMPAGTPRERVQRIQQEVARALAAPDMKARLDDLGLMPVASAPEAFASFIQRDIDLHARIAQAAKIEPQ
jgi:tripartite-type tricarboxylate transporter receptor subunit TctC